jgi:hypothetical protein
LYMSLEEGFPSTGNEDDASCAQRVSPVLIQVPIAKSNLGRDSWGESCAAAT